MIVNSLPTVTQLVMVNVLSLFSVCVLMLVQTVASAYGAIRKDSTAVFSSYGLGVTVGTMGIGVQAAYQFSTKLPLTLRAGLSYFNYQKSFHVSTKDDARLYVSPDVALSNAQASLQWHPFTKSSFFVTLGAGYVWNPRLSAIVQTHDKVNFGGIEMTPDNFGVIQSSVHWQRLRGFAGVGFGRAVPARRIGFSAEMGCYYLGSPRVDLNYSGFLETTTLREQIPVIERNLSGYCWLPALQLSITYAIHPRH